MHSSKYLILGFTFSEKSWVYLLATQLALSNGTSSLISSISGMIAGLIYGMEGLGLASYRLPHAVYVISHTSHSTSSTSNASSRPLLKRFPTSLRTSSPRHRDRGGGTKSLLPPQPTETTFMGEEMPLPGILNLNGISTQPLHHRRRRL